MSYDPVHRPSPLNLNEGTRHILKQEFNLLKEHLYSLEIFTSNTLLRIKEKKTHIMKFSFSRQTDFPAELMINGFNDKLAVVRETKLIGIILTNDLKWAGLQSRTSNNP